MAIDPAKIKNIGEKGCMICQNPEISAITDPIIFNAECDLKTLKERLESDGFHVDARVLSSHVKHIFLDTNKEVIESPVDTESEKFVINNSSNLELVKDGLANIIRAEKKLLLNGKEDTKEYLDIIVEKRRIIELKSKLEGELNDDTGKVTVPVYIKMLE